MKYTQSNLRDMHRAWHYEKINSEAFKINKKFFNTFAKFNKLNIRFFVNTVDNQEYCYVCGTRLHSRMKEKISPPKKEVRLSLSESLKIFLNEGMSFKDFFDYYYYNSQFGIDMKYTITHSFETHPEEWYVEQKINLNIN